MRKAIIILLFLTFFLLGLKPQPLLAQPKIAVSLSFSKNFYSNAESFNASGTVTNFSPEVLKYNRITLTIYNKIVEGESLGNINLRQKKVFFRYTWYKRLPSGESKFNFSRNLESYSLSEGVYPAEFSVVLRNGEVFKAFSYLVILNPKEVPLSVALVWDLYEPLHISPDGVFLDNDLALRISTAPGNPGFYDQFLAKLMQHSQVKVNFTVSPLLIKQLKLMAKGYAWHENGRIKKVDANSSEAQAAKEMLLRLGNLSRDGRGELLLSSYSGPPLPFLAARDWREDFNLQWTKGRAVLKDVFSWKEGPKGFYSPRQQLDRKAARWLEETGAAYTVLDSQLIYPKLKSSPLTPFQSGRLVIFATDTEASEILKNSAPREVKSKLTALLALQILRKKEPSLVTIAPLAPWYPQPELLEEVYQFFEQTPWLQTVNLAQASSQFSPQEIKITKVIPFEGANLTTVQEVRGSLKSFLTAVYPQNKLGQTLRDHFLLGESLDSLEGGEHPKLGEDYLEVVDKKVKEEFSKVKIIPSRVTFSGKKGKIPIAISNGTNYPLKLSLRVRGKGFSFADDRLRKVVLMPKDNLVTYNVGADFLGSSYLSISLESGERKIAEGQIEVKVSNTARYLFAALALSVVVIIFALALRRSLFR